MHAGNAVLDPVNVQATCRGGRRPASGVAMPVAAVLAGTVHQPLDLPLSEVASFNCQIYDGWCAFLGCRFHADKPCLRATYCLAYAPSLHSIMRAAKYDPR